MVKDNDKVLVLAPLELTWVVHRITATGPDAAAFARDFMASVNRTKFDARCSRMDGVFATTTTQPPQVTAHLTELRSFTEGAPISCLSQRPYSIVDRAVVTGTYHNLVSLIFASHYQPVYEKHHLIAISNAYPRASFTFDYAGRRDNVYGRWIMCNGVANKVSPADLVAVMREPEFLDIINRA